MQDIFWDRLDNFLVHLGTLPAGQVSALADAATAIVSFLMLLIVWQKLSKLNEGNKNLTYQNVYERMIEIDRFFIDHPNLKPYFYSNKEYKSESQEVKDQLLSVAEMMVDFFDNVYFQQNSMRKSTFKAKAFYFGDVYNNSPVIRDYLRRPGLENWYAKDFLKFLKQQGDIVQKYIEQHPDIKR